MLPAISPGAQMHLYLSQSNSTFVLNHRQIYVFHINIANKILIINHLCLFEIKNTCTYRVRKLEFLRFNGIFSVLIPLFTGIFFS